MAKIGHFEGFRLAENCSLRESPSSSPKGALLRRRWSTNYHVGKHRGSGSLAGLCCCCFQEEKQGQQQQPAKLGRGLKSPQLAQGAELEEMTTNWATFGLDPSSFWAGFLLWVCSSWAIDDTISAGVLTRLWPLVKSLRDKS